MAEKSESGKTDHGPFSTVGSNAARYKSMSPAKLPISRSTCLTIPPGLSPTSLLESPVLLSNIKVAWFSGHGKFGGMKHWTWDPPDERPRSQRWDHYTVTGNSVTPIKDRITYAANV